MTRRMSLDETGLVCIIPFGSARANTRGTIETVFPLSVIPYSTREAYISGTAESVEAIALGTPITLKASSHDRGLLYFPIPYLKKTIPKDANAYDIGCSPHLRPCWDKLVVQFYKISKPNNP